MINMNGCLKDTCKGEFNMLSGTRGRSSDALWENNEAGVELC